MSQQGPTANPPEQPTGSKDDVLRSRMMRALNKVCKWRAVFVGWQLGTRVKGDPEADAVRDAVERSILMRVELNAMLRLMLEKRLCTIEEWMQHVHDEALTFDRLLEAKFPGVKSTDTGLTMDAVTMREHGTMRGWKP